MRPGDHHILSIPLAGPAPQIDGSVFARGHDPLPIRTERGAIDVVGVLLERLEHFTAGNVPQLRGHPLVGIGIAEHILQGFSQDWPIFAGNQQPLAIRTELGGVDVIRPTSERTDLIAVGSIPEPGGAVIATAHDLRTIRAEIDGHNTVRVSRKHARLISIRDIPEYCGSVEAATDECLPIRTESHCPNVEAVPRKRANQRPVRHIPEGHNSVLPGTRNRLPVRTESEAPERIRAGSDAASKRAVLEVPDPQHTVVTRGCDRPSIRAEVGGGDPGRMFQILDNRAVRCPHLGGTIRGGAHDQSPVRAETRSPDESSLGGQYLVKLEDTAVYPSRIGPESMPG